MQNAALINAVLSSLTLALSGMAAMPSYSITRIMAAPGTFQPPALSPVVINSGGTVAGTAFLPQMFDPFTFSAGAFTLLGIPGTHDTGSQITGFNDAGQLIGIEQGPLMTAYGFVYYQGKLTPLPGKFAPAGINNAGSIAGTLAHAMLYQNGSLTDLGTLGGSHSSAAAINANGQIAGTSSLPGDTVSHAFLYSGSASPANTLTDLGTLGGANSTATSINFVGDVVGTSDVPGGATHAFRSSSGFMIDLGTLAGYTNSYATAINAQGQVVGTATNLQGSQVTGSSAFIWNGYMTDLNSLIPAGSGWVLTSAVSINDAGQIVGTGTFNGQPGAAFLLNPLASAPDCVINGSTSPVRQLAFYIGDTISGLQSIDVSKSMNATVEIPVFTPGSTFPVTVTATQIDPSQNATVQLSVTNTAGVSISCGSSLSAGPPQWSGFGGVLISNVVAAENSDGRLEVFGLGTHHGLWHIAQTSPGGTWGEWSSLGGESLSGDPTVGTDSDGRLEVFVISSDNMLWNIAQTTPGSWSGSTFKTVAAGVQGRAAVVRDLAGYLYFFARAVDDTVVFSSQTSVGSSGWGALSELGGVITNNPAAAVDGSGSLRVFATGTDQALWTIQVNASGPVGTWTSLGGSLIGDVALTTGLDGPLQVFARAADNSLMYTAQLGQSLWTAWTNIGGRTIGKPEIAWNSDGRLEVFAIGADNELWHIAYNPAAATPWTSWESLGGYLLENDIAPIRGPNSLTNVFVIGGDHGLWGISQSVPGYWN
jgi:probable HAF family extracellular repeat protein